MSTDQLIETAKQFLFTHNQANYLDAFDSYFTHLA